ncbi:MAG: hypothetical protein JNM17_14505 [Archangium sp.]|nr:hypothetical protein [Archangium sp.]
MNQTAFARLEKECVRAVSGNATAGMLAVAFAPLAKRLSAAEKISAVLHFLKRDARRRRSGQSDWLAWYFVHGAIRGAVVLPWSRVDLETLLRGVIAESHALPPEFIARAVGQFIKANGPPDKELSKLGTRAARSLWPPGASEGANFKAAAAKLKQHMSA